jgi:hypothetical protein
MKLKDFISNIQASDFITKVIEKAGEKIGNWLLDITKYVITVLVLTKVFNFLPNTWVTVVCIAILALIGAAWGFYLTRKK